MQKAVAIRLNNWRNNLIYPHNLATYTVLSVLAVVSIRDSVQRQSQHKLQAALSHNSTVSFFMGQSVIAQRNNLSCNINDCFG